MFKKTFILTALLYLFSVVSVGCAAGAGKKVYEADVVVYGDASGGVSAAVQAGRMGKKVILISQYGHLGGMTSSGLGWTDIGNTSILGGLSREFYHRVYQHYQKDAAWDHEPRSEFSNKGQGAPALDPKTELASTFEPKVAEAVFDAMVKKAGVKVIKGSLDLDRGVSKSAMRITAIRLEDGSRVKGKMFIDASYEGDLLAVAGVSFRVGREANLEYDEKGNGITGPKGGNQLPKGIDPYVVKGDPSSGILAGVNPDMGGKVGDGDHRFQAYCYRMVLTDVPSNRIAVTKPANYDAADYELLFRAIEVGQKNRFFKTTLVPNRKTDANNASGISCDLIGGNYGKDWNWATLNHEQRQAVALKHRDWQLGLVWTLQNHRRVPKEIRDSISVWGLAKDEFTDNSNWPYNLYVREARRMKSDFVMTENHCRRKLPVDDPVGMGAYTLDSHNVQRFVQNGMVRNEGDIQSRIGGKAYGISYRSIVPIASECENLLVPWALSSTHTAFGSIRMEPVFMVLGQSAATAACIAIDENISVQAVPYKKLRKRLLKDDQRLDAELAVSITGAVSNVIWQEAEQFASTGKWSNDPQHMDIMGSPYLLATGVGKPVDDAVTTVKVEKKDTYTLWVRCRDWLPSHSPGRFQVIVDGKSSGVTFGKAKTDNWQWVEGGKFKLQEGEIELCLDDTTGWWGRCDAIVLATGGFKPSNEKQTLAKQRLKYGGVSYKIKDMGKYDLVVVGGGPAGMTASIAAARNGIKVALIQDRPVLGGNSSSEIQVPPMGYIGDPPDKLNVTGITAEIFPKQGWSNFANSEKMEKIVSAEENIALFLNTRAVDVELDSKIRIKAVIALDVHSGKRMRFSAPLFADTTGHGWVGFYAGAEWRMGQEARTEFNESLAPVKAGNRTQGNTLYKAIITERKEPVPFDCPDWAYQWKSKSDFDKVKSVRSRSTVRPENFDRHAHGKGWDPGNDPDGSLTYSFWVEYGGIENTIEDAEHIRDELFRINIGLWNYAKNHNSAAKDKNLNRELVWLNYVPGVRESRRLVGDYILTQKDYDEQIVHDDTVAFTDWGPDCHHPEGFWTKGVDCIHTYPGRRTSIPYRSLYSKNIENLFMAGRCHSTTHIALGGTRVMRPCAGMGQAVGTAAAIATKNKETPRGVYKNHIKELQDTLVKDGCRLMKKSGGMREPSE